MIIGVFLLFIGHFSFFPALVFAQNLSLTLLFLPFFAVANAKFLKQIFKQNFDFLSMLHVLLVLSHFSQLETTLSFLFPTFHTKTHQY